MKRFAFDLGSGSLGWAVFDLDEDHNPVALTDMGVRIFPTGRDPKSKESNAVSRRLARQQRRQTDRRLKRRKELEGKLIDAGLMPARTDANGRSEFFNIDPYEARGRAARGKVSLYELGRAIWHISKHRGFKSNRIVDRENERDEKKKDEKQEKGQIARASATLSEELDKRDDLTYGTWLAGRHANGEVVRVRRHSEGVEKGYDFYPTREMLEDEFDKIWCEQKSHHAGLDDEVRDTIRDSVFFQRPLKRVDPGRCTLFPNKKRLPKWHPFAQEYLVLQLLNHLRITLGDSQRSLNLSERNLIAKHLMSGGTLTWAKFRRTLKLPSETLINFENDNPKQKGPIHNALEERLVGTKKKPGPLADYWRQWDIKDRFRLLCILDRASTPKDVVSRLVNKCGLDREIAEQVEKVNLPDGYLNLCKQAVRGIVEIWREQVVTYSDAVDQASKEGRFGEGVVLHHSDLRPDGYAGLPELPPYNQLPSLQRMIGMGTGNPDDPPDIQYGRIGNPTVHVALGQFRRVMNTLIARYGKPIQVFIETTRDMAKSGEEVKKINKEIENNTKQNDEWRKELEEGGVLTPGASVSDHLLRMRLWTELGSSCADRCCPYSGKPISLEQLHSPAVEIDHILPFAETLDDSSANKTVCFRAANQIKGKRTPGGTWSGDELKAIIERVKGASGMKRKVWRFMPDALEQWQSHHKDFENRQLHATSYLARVVVAYVNALYPKDGRNNIRMPRGGMTAMMRRRWKIHLPGHKTKIRDDHRHHALDAAVIGVIDGRMIQMLQTHARKKGIKELGRVLPDLPEPFKGFREQIQRRISTVYVSHRPERPSIQKQRNKVQRVHGGKKRTHIINGRLQKDTAYGFISENDPARSQGNLVTRKPVIELSKDDIRNIRDDQLRQELCETTEGKERIDALKEWQAVGDAETGPNSPERLKKQRKWIEENFPDYENRSKKSRARIRAKANKLLGTGVKPNVARHVRVLVKNSLAKPVAGRRGHPREGEYYKWMIPGENIYIDILECSDGRWISHITDIWAAASRTASYWKDVHPDAVFIMRLYKGDTVQLFDSEKGSYPIKQVSSIKTDNGGRLVLVEINDARLSGKQDKESLSVGPLEKRRARRVRIDELGRVRIVPHGKDELEELEQVRVVPHGKI